MGGRAGVTLATRRVTRVIVASAPRSGTHMVVRTLSRAGRLPWKVPVPLSTVPLIREPSWVVGVHAVYEDARHIAAQVEAVVLGLVRYVGHADSLQRFGMTADDPSVRAITASMPPDCTVTYDRLIAGNPHEIGRLASLSGVAVAAVEPWQDRYRGGFDWSPGAVAPYVTA